MAEAAAERNRSLRGWCAGPSAVSVSAGVASYSTPPLPMWRRVRVSNCRLNWLNSARQQRRLRLAPAAGCASSIVSTPVPMPAKSVRVVRLRSIGI